MQTFYEVVKSNGRLSSTPAVPASFLYYLK